MNPGPWYIAILQDCALNRKIIVHTFAEHYAFAYGIVKPKEQWVMLELIGPFGDEDQAQQIGGLIQLGEFDGNLEDGINRWNFNELIKIPEYTVLTLGAIKKLKSTI